MKWDRWSNHAFDAQNYFIVRTSSLVFHFCLSSFKDRSKIGGINNQDGRLNMNKHRASNYSIQIFNTTCDSCIGGFAASCLYEQ